jgi:tyrosyl-tRNA synthetase
VSANLPTVSFDWAGPKGEFTQRRAEAIVAVGLSISQNEAKRLIEGKGVKIDDQHVAVGQWFNKQEVFKISKRTQIVLVKPV